MAYQPSENIKNQVHGKATPEEIEILKKFGHNVPEELVEKPEEKTEELIEEVDHTQQEPVVEEVKTIPEIKEEPKVEEPIVNEVKKETQLETNDNTNEETEEEPERVLEMDMLSKLEPVTEDTDDNEEKKNKLGLDITYWMKYKYHPYVPSMTYTDFAWYDPEKIENDDVPMYQTFISHANFNTLNEMILGNAIMQCEEKCNDPKIKLSNKPMVKGKELIMKQALPKVEADKATKPGAIKALIKNKLGVGTPISIPLWNSGFSVVINPITPNGIMELEKRINNKLIHAGRLTNHVAYSSYDGFIYEAVMEVFKDLIKSTNLAIDDISEIDQYIAVTDMYPIIMAIMAGVYTRGMDISIPCKNTGVQDEETKLLKCDHVTKALLDLTKLIYVDYKGLPEAYTRQLRANSVSLEEADAYRKAVSDRANREIELFDGIKVHIGIPSVNTFVSTSVEWLHDINKRTDNIITNVKTKQEQDALLTELNAVVQCNTHRPYIEAIEMDGQKLTEYDDISETIESLGYNDEALSKLLGAVATYIEDTLMSVVAIPSYICPKCKESQTDKDGKRFDRLIPLSVNSLFFYLVTRFIPKA